MVWYPGRVPVPNAGHDARKGSILKYGIPDKQELSPPEGTPKNTRAMRQHDIHATGNRKIKVPAAENTLRILKLLASAADPWRRRT